MLIEPSKQYKWSDLSRLTVSTDQKEKSKLAEKQMIDIQERNLYVQPCQLLLQKASISLELLSPQAQCFFTRLHGNVFGTKAGPIECNEHIKVKDANKYVGKHEVMILD